MEIFGKTILALRKMLDEKQISEQELFDYFKKRIAKYNPSLNALLTTCEISYEKTENKNLLGIPLAIKDNHSTKGIKTTASAKLLENYIPPFDATVVARLKKSGAKILGKTNMDAWAHGSSNETSEFGPVKNPWDLERVPGGSSGGTASAVASYISPAGIGSETAGSIRIPSSWCGIVGLKPTYGRVSRYGVIAMGSSLDSPGPMTISVKDAGIILQTIAGKDEFDATTAENFVPNYLEKIDQKNSYIIGIPDEYFEGADEDVQKTIMNAVHELEKQGHKTKKVKLIPPKYSISVYTIIQRAEVSSNLARFDGIRFGHDRTTFGNEAKRRMMLGGYTLAHGYYDAYYKKAQKVRSLLVEDFKNAFSEVDFILGPVAPITALKLGESSKYPFFGELMDQLNEPSSLAGLPAITFPVGIDKNNMPIGLQLIANHFEEEKLLNIGNLFEQETDFFGVIKKGLEKYKD